MAKKTGTNARGVAKLDLGDGRSIGLKLTLSAMDEIETEFELESIADLEQKLDRPSAKSLAKLVAIMARAAGETVTEDDIRKAPVELPDLIQAVMAALTPNQGGEVEKNGAAPTA